MSKQVFHIPRIDWVEFSLIKLRNNSSNWTMRIHKKYVYRTKANLCDETDPFLIFQTFFFISFDSFNRPAIYIFRNNFGASRIVSSMENNRNSLLLKFKFTVFLQCATFHFQFTWSQTNRFQVNYQFDAVSTEHRLNTNDSIDCLQTPQTLSNINWNERITFPIYISLTFSIQMKINFFCCCFALAFVCLWDLEKAKWVKSNRTKSD